MSFARIFYLSMQRAVAHFTIRRAVRGMSVRYMRPMPTEDAATFDRVCEAVKLLAERDPVRFSRTCRDLDFVLVFPLAAGAGEYWPARRACVLNRGLVSRASMTVAEIAAVIVHEATHARLRATGVDLRTPDERRVEEVCVRAELRFAARLPDRRMREAVHKAANFRLNHLAAHPDAYSPRGRFDRSQRGARQFAPDWLIRFVDRWRPAA